MINKHMKEYSASPIIREMVSKTKMRYHFILIRKTIIKRKNNTENNMLARIQKLKPLFIAGRNVKWYSHFGKQYGSSSKN